MFSQKVQLSMNVFDSDYNDDFILNDKFWTILQVKKESVPDWKKFEQVDIKSVKFGLWGQLINGPATFITLLEKFLKISLVYLK